MKPLDDKTLTMRRLVHEAANLGRLREALATYKKRIEPLLHVASDELGADLKLAMQQAESALDEEEKRIGARTTELFERKSPRSKAPKPPDPPAEGSVWEHPTTHLAYQVKDGDLRNILNDPSTIPIVFESPWEMGYREVDAEKIPPRNSKWYSRKMGAVLLVEYANAEVVDYRMLSGGKWSPSVERSGLLAFHLTCRPAPEVEKLRTLFVRGSQWKSLPGAAEEYTLGTVTFVGYAPTENCVTFLSRGSNPVTYAVASEVFLANFRPVVD